MLCPYCSHHTSEEWQPLYTKTDHKGNFLKEPRSSIWPEFEDVPPTSYSVEWMVCRNQECLALIVRISEYDGMDGVHTRIAVPDGKTVTVDQLVPHDLARDYREAWMILDDSPRMSSILSRKILADLLKQYAECDQYNLATRIDEFIANNRTPPRFRDNLHYLREMGNFSAHTMTDEDGNIIEVSKEEAGWTLKVVADLFDYTTVRLKTLRAAASRCW